MTGIIRYAAEIVGIRAAGKNTMMIDCVQNKVSHTYNIDARGLCIVGLSLGSVKLLVDTTSNELLSVISKQDEELYCMPDVANIPGYDGVSDAHTGTSEKSDSKVLALSPIYLHPEIMTQRMLCETSKGWNDWVAIYYKHISESSLVYFGLHELVAPYVFSDMVKIALALAYDDITRHPCYTHDCAHRALQYHVCEVYDRFSELTKYATPFERPVSPYELMRDVAETAKVRGEGCTDLDEMLWSQGVDNAGELKNNISYEILNDQSYIKPYIPMVDTFDPNDYVSAKKDLLNNAKKDAHDSAYLYDTTGYSELTREQLQHRCLHSSSQQLQ